MPPTHVCLISGQPIPNLIPLLMEKPERAIFLVSNEMQQEAKRLRQVVQSWGIAIEEHRIPPFDLNAVSALCAELIAAHGKEGLTLNVTGGTKVSALSAFEAFYSSGCRIIYVNTTTDELLTLSPSEKKTALPDLIGVRDYLAVYGLTMDKGSGKPPVGAAQRIRQSKRLAELLVDEDSLLQTLNNKSQPHLNRKANGASYLHLEPGDFTVDYRPLFKLLTEAGVTTHGINQGVNINHWEDIFYVGGGWLEEYVFHTVKELGVRDVRINVKVAWDGIGRQSTTNEFDVLFTLRNRLHVISCKAANLEREETGKGKAAIYELDALGDKVGGLFGKTMLVSARRLTEHDQARAGRMGIAVVCGRNLPQLKEALRQWIL